MFFYDKDSDIWEFIRQPHMWSVCMKITKNELCPCNSGKRYKECCRYKLNALNQMMDLKKKQHDNQDFDPYSIPGCFFKEMNPFEYLKRN